MILFTKFSNERSRELSIRTDIVEEDGVRAVRKYPATKEAGPHIHKIRSCYEALCALYQGSRFKANVCLDKGEYVEFEYLEGDTLEDEMDRLLLRDHASLIEKLGDYLGEIEAAADTLFHETDEFVRVFGSAPRLEGTKAFSAANIDMVLNNIIVKDGEWNVTDYEWTFLFPVPVEFIKWRVLNYYINGNSKRFFMKGENLFEKAGIKAKDTLTFERMEKNFQAYVVGSHVPIRELYGDISEGYWRLDETVDLMLKMQHERQKAEGHIYLDCGAGFSEEQKRAVAAWEDGTEEIELSLEGISAARLDPAEAACIVTFEDLSTDQGPLKLFTLSHNGMELGNDQLLFATEDPWVVIRDWKEGSRLLSVRYSKKILDKDTAETVGAVLKKRATDLEVEKARNAEKARIIAQRDQALKTMVSLRSVRAFNKMRKKMGKPDLFESFNVEGKVGPAGIMCVADKTRYREDFFFVKGWVADPDFPVVNLKVVDSTGRLLNAELPRKKRGDVAEAFRMDPEIEYGFSMKLPYTEIENPPVYLVLENQRGFAKFDLGYETDPARRVIETEDETNAYHDWYLKHRTSEEELERERQVSFERVGKFSIVVPLYKTPEEFLRELIESVQAQTYANWELVLSDGSGENSPLTEVLDKWAEEDSRIRPVHNHRQLQISENTNAAIKAATGDIIVFADHDDLLTPDALYRNAEVFENDPEAEAVYSDEDKLSPEGTYVEPNFKPDFNEDYLRSVNYICHLVAVKRELLDRTGLLDPAFNGAQDYDFVLRCSEKTDFRHIPEILYHWRISANSTAEDPKTKLYAFESGKRAIEAHYRRLDLPATVEKGPYLGTYKTNYHWNEKPRVSIVIPNYEHADVLKTCVDSIVNKCTYKNYEIVVIENNSRKQETFDLYKHYQETLPNFKLVTYQGAFNYSAINNFGVREAAEGDYLLFLNNDTEIMAKDCLEQLLYPCMREDVGAVGARLHYEDGDIQHAGTIVGIGGIAGNAFVGSDPGDPGYMSRIVCASDLTCVTAACMMVKADLFEKVGGFYEGLAVAFNDVDLCMKIREQGKLVVYNPYAELYHYESRSRGYEDSPEKIERFNHEADVFRKRWPDILKNGDPYYNRNLTLKRQDFSLKDEDEFDNEQ